MLFYILIAAIVGFTGFNFYYNGWGSALLAFVVTTVVGGMLLLMTADIFYSTGQTVIYEEKNRTVTNLTAMNNGTGIKGRTYFLGGGYIGDTQNITYMYKTEDGGTRLGKQEASRSTVYEVPGEPTMTTIHYKNVEWWLLPFSVESMNMYEFRVPDGTIKESFDLSLEGQK